MNRNRFLAALAGLLIAAGSTAPALAQEANADLYDAVAPADSAFVRLLNLQPVAVEFTLSAKIKPQRVPAGQFGGYRFVPPGPQRVSVAGQNLELTLKANTASTLVVRAGQVTVIDDELVDEKRRAQVAFYNLSQSTVSLKTSDGKHTVVENLGPGQSGSRMVNEVKIVFAAYAGGQRLAVFDDLLLRKGRTYSYALLPDEGGVRAVAFANNIDPTE